MANKEFEVEHPEHHQMKIIDTTGNISLPVSTSGFHFRLPLSETRMNIEKCVSKLILFPSFVSKLIIIF